MGRKEKKRKKDISKKEIYQALYDLFDLNPDMEFTHKQIAERLGLKNIGAQQLLVTVLREMKNDRLLTEIAPGKFQYKDTRFKARCKARNVQECYNRIVDHLRSRQDVDPRSQFPSIKGKNFTCSFLGMNPDEE